MNILITCGGRRDYIVKYFRRALKNHGKIIVCNSISETPAMIEADKAYKVPYVYEKGYIDKLQKICKKHKIDYIFSLHDLDGPILSKNRVKLEIYGAKLVMPDTKIISVCLDKYKTHQFLKSHNVLSPPTWLTPSEFFKEKEKNYPVIIKPRCGYGSINILKARSDEEVRNLYKYFETNKDKKISNYLGFNDKDSSTIIQKYLNGKEYGLGVVNTIKGDYAGSFVLKKISMRAGETDIAVTSKDSSIENLGKTLSFLTRNPGLMDCDIIKANKKIYVLEINPRFGGQYPFFHHAGANIPAFLIGLSEKLKFPLINKKFCKKISIIPYHKNNNKI